MKIYTVTLNPAFDKHLNISQMIFQYVPAEKV